MSSAPSILGVSTAHISTSPHSSATAVSLLAEAEAGIASWALSRCFVSETSACSVQWVRVASVSVNGRIMLYCGRQLIQKDSFKMKSNDSQRLNPRKWQAHVKMLLTTAYPKQFDGIEHTYPYGVITEPRLWHSKRFVLELVHANRHMATDQNPPSGKRRLREKKTRRKYFATPSPHPFVCSMRSGVWSHCCCCCCSMSLHGSNQ